jgi:hypothetical protein
MSHTSASSSQVHNDIACCELLERAFAEVLFMLDSFKVWPSVNHRCLVAKFGLLVDWGVGATTTDNFLHRVWKMHFWLTPMPFGYPTALEQGQAEVAWGKRACRQRIKADVARLIKFDRFLGCFTRSINTLKQWTPDPLVAGA